jgi:hypothetical protein
MLYKLIIFFEKFILFISFIFKWKFKANFFISELSASIWWYFCSDQTNFFRTFNFRFTKNQISRILEKNIKIRAKHIGDIIFVYLSQNSGIILNIRLKEDRV